MRTLVDIPDDDIDKLDALAARQKRSRAAAIREAIGLYLVQTNSNDWIERGYGYWADREDVPDGLAYQQVIRAGLAGQD
jgi:metal-responsive CopG/Arc/MetJ family transcriptional regulator